jgi:hypothetical protein
MSKIKTRTKVRHKVGPEPTVEKEIETPEKKRELFLAARTTTSTLPSSNGLPPIIRAANLITTPYPGSGAAGRACLMTAMQQRLGNARLNRMFGTTEPSRPRPGQVAVTLNWPER